VAAAERVLVLVDRLCAVSPVVLVVDDLQWADEVSVSVWHRLAGGAGFKGGAAFAPMMDLPHVAGLITNLVDDAGMIDRVEAALMGEQQRRQRILRAAGNLDSIRDYQRLHASTGQRRRHAARAAAVPANHRRRVQPGSLVP